MSLSPVPDGSDTVALTTTSGARSLRSNLRNRTNSNVSSPNNNNIELELGPNNKLDLDLKLMVEFYENKGSLSDLIDAIRDSAENINHVYLYASFFKAVGPSLSTKKAKQFFEAIGTLPKLQTISIRFPPGNKKCHFYHKHFSVSKIARMLRYVSGITDENDNKNNDDNIMDESYTITRTVSEDTLADTSLHRSFSNPYTFSFSCSGTNNLKCLKLLGIELGRRRDVNCLADSLQHLIQLQEFWIHSIGNVDFNPIIIALGKLPVLQMIYINTHNNYKEKHGETTTTKSKKIRTTTGTSLGDLLLMPLPSPAKAILSDNDSSTAAASSTIRLKKNAGKTDTNSLSIALAATRWRRIANKATSNTPSKNESATNNQSVRDGAVSTKNISVQTAVAASRWRRKAATASSRITAPTNDNSIAIVKRDARLSLISMTIPTAVDSSSPPRRRQTLAPSFRASQSSGLANSGRSSNSSISTAVQTNSISRKSISIATIATASRWRRRAQKSALKNGGNPAGAATPARAIDDGAEIGDTTNHDNDNASANILTDNSGSKASVAAIRWHRNTPVSATVPADTTNQDDLLGNTSNNNNDNASTDVLMENSQQTNTMSRKSISIATIATASRWRRRAQKSALKNGGNSASAATPARAVDDGAEIGDTTNHDNDNASANILTDNSGSKASVAAIRWHRNTETSTMNSPVSATAPADTTIQKNSQDDLLEKTSSNNNDNASSDLLTENSRRNEIGMHAAVAAIRWRRNTEKSTMNATNQNINHDILLGNYSDNNNSPINNIATDNSNSTLTVGHARKSITIHTAVVASRWRRLAQKPTRSNKASNPAPVPVVATVKTNDIANEKINYASSSGAIPNNSISASTATTTTTASATTSKIITSFTATTKNVTISNPDPDKIYDTANESITDSLLGGVHTTSTSSLTTTINTTETTANDKGDENGDVHNNHHVVKDSDNKINDSKDNKILGINDSDRRDKDVKFLRSSNRSERDHEKDTMNNNSEDSLSRRVSSVVTSSVRTRFAKSLAATRSRRRSLVPNAIRRTQSSLISTYLRRRTLSRHDSNDENRAQSMMEISNSNDVDFGGAGDDSNNPGGEKSMVSSTLKGLSITNLHLGPDQLVSLFDVLETKNFNLCWLSLVNVPLSPKKKSSRAVLSLGCMLQRNSTLQWLTLNNVGLSDNDCKIIINSLYDTKENGASNKRLVNISSNHDIARLRRSNSDVTSSIESGLVKLDIRGNNEVTAISYNNFVEMLMSYRRFSSTKTAITAAPASDSSTRTRRLKLQQIFIPNKTSNDMMYQKRINSLLLQITKKK